MDIVLQQNRRESFLSKSIDLLLAPLNTNTLGEYNYTQFMEFLIGK